MASSLHAKAQDLVRAGALALALLSAAHCGKTSAQPVDFASAQQRVQQFNQAGDFQQALQWAEQLLIVAERDYGQQSTQAATAHLLIAIQTQGLGRLPAAEDHYRRGLAIQERLVPAEDLSLASFLGGLGGMLYGQGRYEDAEPFMRKSLRLQELYARQTGNETGLGVALYMLGTNYTSMLRLDDAYRLLERALTVFEHIAPQGSLQIAFVLNNLATNRQIANDYRAAVGFQQRTLELFQRLAPDNVAGLAKINNNLGFLFDKSGEPGKAADHYRRAIAQLRQAFPDGHPDIATGNVNYGLLLLNLGRPREAEPLLTSALAMRRRWLPADHPEIALAHGALADLWLREGNWARTVAELRASADIYIARAARQDAGRGSAAGNDIGQNTLVFKELVKAMHRAAPSEAGPAFVMAQHATGSSAAASLAQMATRSVKGDAGLARIVRTRQDLVAQWHALDRQLVGTMSNPVASEAASEPIRQQLASLDGRIAELDRDLAARFPEYAALTSPAPLTIEDVRADLHADEALVQVLDTPRYASMPEETFVWVVTRTSQRWLRSQLGSAALAREVAALRCGLDYVGAWLAEGSQCAQLTGVDYTRADYEAGRPLPFDVKRAHALYAALLAGAEDLMKDKQLLVVPSGPLTKLPLHVLVTAAPASGKGNLRETAWLARTHALTVLPAVSSLKALRRNARPSAAREPFLGLGDPVLSGSCVPPAIPAHCPGDRIDVATVSDDAHQANRSASPLSGTASYFRNGLADVAAVRQLCPLPETAHELKCVARSLGASDDSLRLGGLMTETVLKRTPLERYRVIHFATHGILAGEMARLSAAKAEPALVMTPPSSPTEDDDGLLTASEVAALKLDADWVVMSACNTAAAGSEDAEALSGLARAFFYAGARALLVSHWPVDSYAATVLTSETFAELRSHPDIGRSRSFQRAMLSLIDDKRRPWAAHPSVWAPFVVVGEGAAPAGR